MVWMERWCVFPPRCRTSGKWELRNRTRARTKTSDPRASEWGGLGSLQLHWESDSTWIMPCSLWMHAAKLAHSSSDVMRSGYEWNDKNPGCFKLVLYRIIQLVIYSIRRAWVITVIPLRTWQNICIPFLVAVFFYPMTEFTSRSMWTSWGFCCSFLFAFGNWPLHMKALQLAQVLLSTSICHLDQSYLMTYLKLYTLDLTKALFNYKSRFNWLNFQIWCKLSLLLAPVWDEMVSLCRVRISEWDKKQSTYLQNITVQ